MIPRGDFESLDPQRAQTDPERWRTECRRSDDALAQYETLEAHPPGRKAPARWLVQKVIGEYARHNGHADLIQEAIDGQTGE